MAAVSVALVLTGVYFVGRLAWVVIGGSRIVLRGTRRARADLKGEYQSLTAQELRRRLVSNQYFTTDLRANAQIESFLGRVTADHEAALRRQFSKAKLYAMLASAEREIGRTGRPEAVEYGWTIFALLDELARRKRSDVQHPV